MARTLTMVSLEHNSKMLLSPRLRGAAVCLLFLSGLIAPGQAQAQAPDAPTLFGRDVEREGFHFNFAFGVGGGAPDIFGLHHTMEIGGTFSNGMTVALFHTFIQNRGVGANSGGPDLIGAWMAELKVPLFVPEVVAKVALGLGGEQDQNDGIRLIPGLGWAYGVDLHFPVGPRHGPTLGLTVLHTLAEGRHSLGVGLALGWTLY
ncbi:MAG: hypothetical protein JRH11_06905 [Deltaproteobacteria bacterium]|nr:hypothetical protein [Deltaproteobacteria bacterium]